MKKLAENREQRVEEIKQHLLRDRFPRLEISVILLFTALSGFLVSFGLLHAGFASMTLRYPVCIAVAYGVFLLLLRLWLALHNPHSRTNDLIDVPDFPSNTSSQGFSSANGGKGTFEFGGGDFGGAGAGGSWDGGVSPTVSGGSSSILDGVDLGFDLEEIGLIILAVIAILGGLLATFYIVWIAPILLAEILVDGVLITGLYHRVKKIERRHWLQTAVKRTWLLAVLAALFFSFAGFVMHKTSPEARSIGEFLNHTNDGKNKKGGL